MKNIFFIYLLLLLSISACKKDSSNSPTDDSMNNTKPYVELISPLDHSYAIVGDTIFISAIASDEDGSVITVLFYNNSKIFAYDSIYPWEQFLICPNKNEIMISAIAVDNNNALSKKAAAQLIIQKEQTPSVQIRKNIYHVVENDSVDFIINSQSPNGKIKKVDFYLNNILIGTDSLEQCTFTVESMVLGNYNAYAIVEDEKGLTKKSTDLLFTVYENQAPELEFGIHSYSGFFPGKRISISLHATDSDGSIDSVFVYVNDSLLYSSDDYYPSGLYFTPPKGGIYRFYAIGSDNRGLLGYSDTIETVIKPGYTMDGKIVDLTNSNYNDLVFGLDQTNNKLLLINPITTEKEEISLPHSNPIKFYYSMRSEKLYIIYKYDGLISVWNYKTNSFSEISFSSNADAVDIEVDDLNRRIYVLASDDLYIINQDNGELLNTSSLNNMYDIAIDPINRWLFTCSQTSSISVKKYNVENDEKELIQNSSISGSYKNQIRINQKYNYFIIPGLGGSQSNLALDIDNINNTVGEFTYNEWYNYSYFTPDENILFTGLNNYDDNQINVMNAEDYSFIDQIKVPNSDHALISTNSNQTKLVVFSFKGFSDESEFALYFFDINYHPTTH